MGICGLYQDGTIFKFNCGYDLLAVIGLLDVLPAGFVLVYVDPVVEDTLFAKELLGLLAIGAPRGTLDRYLCVGHLLSSKATETGCTVFCT